jgi:hypothetical protein
MDQHDVTRECAGVWFTRNQQTIVHAPALVLNVIQSAYVYAPVDVEAGQLHAPRRTANLQHFCIHSATVCWAA